MLSKQFLTVKDVAELLKVGDVTVRRWIRGGNLRAIALGREWRIAPADLEDFLRRHETVGRPGDQARHNGGKPTVERAGRSPGSNAETR